MIPRSTICYSKDPKRVTCRDFPCRFPGTKKCSPSSVLFLPITGFECHCAEGYEGQFCEQPVHECRSQPCQNSAQCVELEDSPGYECICAAGYEGALCQHDINECASDPCSFKSDNAICVDKINGYECHCRPGFQFPPHCDVDINECASSPCMNGGTCTDQENGFRCYCAAGYEGDRCALEIDECASNPCPLFKSVCKDQVNGYECGCFSGFYGLHCEHACPCEHQQPCGYNQEANNTNTVECMCGPGFGGINCSTVWFGGVIRQPTYLLEWLRSWDTSRLPKPPGEWVWLFHMTMLLCGCGSVVAIMGILMRQKMAERQQHTHKHNSQNNDEPRSYKNDKVGSTPAIVTEKVVPQVRPSHALFFHAPYSTLQPDFARHPHPIRSL